MSFVDLRAFLDHLESRGDLVRVRAEVDPNQEVTIIQHRVLAAGGPALLFERVKGSPYRLATNLFGTPSRVEAAFGGDPGEIGQAISDLADQLMPPTPGAVWRARGRILRMLRARMRNVRGGPVLETRAEPPRLDELPCLTCWPLDGGPFFTLPLVHTRDPETGAGNLGIYRMQRYDAATTGMHWQIEKGGGAHFRAACEQGRPLPISVMLGGPPALTLAAIAPLPEGVDERLLAALIMGRPLDVIPRAATSHRVAAAAEFVLEGSVRPDDVRREGPFGDHLGHYSHSADFPVFRVDRVLARRDAIFPATVVGKPPQEDYYIGEALQEMTLPLLRMVQPGVENLWAFPETGFHPLAAAGVRQRYAREALKYAFGLLGPGQLSLTKVMIVVDHDVDVRSFPALSQAIWENLGEDGVHLIAPTAQDTLDFTGPSMNEGSRLILNATRGPGGRLRGEPPIDPPKAEDVHRHILGLARLGPAVLMAQVADGANRQALMRELARHRATREYLFHVLVSADVPLDDPRLMLWGWFTRFDPLADLHPAQRRLAGNRMVLEFPIAIDATWKPGYRKPVAFDPDRERAVDARWDEYGI